MTDNPFDPDYVAPLVDEMPRPPKSTVKYYHSLEQGSDDWFEARRGILTASEMSKLLTPKTLKLAANDDVRAHVWKLLAERVTGYVEPTFTSFAMARGHEEEVEARIAYSERFEPVTECGFVTNDKWGFTIGYSPDGLVGKQGQIEAKSRNQRYQIETLVEWVPKQAVPTEFAIQCQTGLLVTEREWIDFISYCGGMHMCVIRAYPDETIQTAIIEAAQAFEEQIKQKMAIYREVMVSDARLIPTERRIEEEMHE